MVRLKHGDHIIQPGYFLDHHGIYVQEYLLPGRGDGGSGGHCVIHHPGLDCSGETTSFWKGKNGNNVVMEGVILSDCGEFLIPMSKGGSELREKSREAAMGDIEEDVE